MVGAKHAIGVGTGLDALRLAFEAAGVQAGDEVIVPANTFIATALACRPSARCRCWWTATPSPTTSSRPHPAGHHEEDEGICPVHLYGQAADLDAVTAIAAESGLKVIEDACQAHGTKYKGRGCGPSATSARSVSTRAKNLGAMGDGRHGHDQRRRPGREGAPDPQLRRTEEVTTTSRKA